MSDRRQRQKEMRAAKRETERKQKARKELGRRLITALVFGLIVVGIFALGGLFGRGETDIPASYEDYRDQATACDAAQPPAEAVMTFAAPEQQADISEGSTVTATITTSCGEIVIDLNTSAAPETVNSFVFLAREGFYDGQVLHRIVENFVFQGGDPSADGTGGPGYFISDEFPEDGFVYEEGVVAMANRGARTTGSQFFVVTGDDGRFLTNSFNVLGTVISGDDAIRRVMEVETAQAPGSNERSLPLESVYVEAVTIEVSDS
ncbi:MAG TPA: peptidylprolyl isomerase [Acidimicrobiia bacterium]|jgi:cyclophilin family peptidyl-prolyl cis-trans isomerase